MALAVWDLTQFPDWRKQAAEEVAKFFPSREDMTMLALEDLPILNAVLMESMRFHGVDVSSNRRKAPMGGTTLLGYFIPEGVNIVHQMI